MITYWVTWTEHWRRRLKPVWTKIINQPFKKTLACIVCVCVCVPFRPPYRTSCALGHWYFQSQSWSPRAMAFMDMRQMVTAIVPTITSKGWEATNRPCNLKRLVSIITVTGLNTSPGDRETENWSSTTHRREQGRKLRWTDAHVDCSRDFIKLLFKFLRFIVFISTKKFFFFTSIARWVLRIKN